MVNLKEMIEYQEVAHNGISTLIKVVRLKSLGRYSLSTQMAIWIGVKDLK